MKNLFRLAAALLSAALLAACGISSIATGSPSDPLFRTNSATASVTFSHRAAAIKNLYVVDYASSKVMIYARGSSEVLRTISHGLFRPHALTFDRRGNLYVDADTNVKAYAPGKTSLLRTIYVGGDPITLLFDASENLYVAQAIVP